LSKLNIKYLQHNTLTDIITFNYSLKNNYLNGEIYISIERIKENAKKFNTTFLNELHRVIIHGILHLIGFKDKTSKERKIMKLNEEENLKLFETICKKIE
jgi:probable rRNA maturation factor